ncbi:hypothetical protein, partial [Xenorhabdus griffiniae]|uniref:hypothetical protein n=1 Tax=Xenorhabdus griffiniae TaxID=351672 RepID=UPI001CB8BB10
MGLKKLGIAPGTLRGQLPHQGMFLTQDKPFIRLAMPLVPVFIPFNTENMFPLQADLFQLPDRIRFNSDRPERPAHRMIGVFNARTVRVITLNIAVGLRFFHD